MNPIHRVGVVPLSLLTFVLLSNLGCATQGQPGLPESVSTDENTADALPASDDSSSASASSKGRSTMMDTTIGTYGAGREDQLILVTMETLNYEELVDGDLAAANSSDIADWPGNFAQFLQAVETNYGITRVADWPLNTIGIRCLVFESDGSRSRADIVAALNNDPVIETAQAVQLFNAQQSNYNDPYLPLQHGLHALQADQVHGWSTGRDVSVAVIDTGLDSEHPDLAESLVDVRNFVDTDTQQFLNDTHGTAVAGIIAAAADNDTGMVGVAPEAKIVGLKACWRRSDSASATCNSYTLAKALNYAIGNEVDVINLSLAGPRDPLLERLVGKAIAANIVVVGAQDPANQNAFPSVLNTVIGVDQINQPLGGRFLAPGSKVLSTAPTNHYEFFDGTSFSAAHVSGVVALLRQLQPDITPFEVAELLHSSSESESAAINACRAVALLDSGAKIDCSQSQSLPNS
ncbi:MAG: S8 family serine peptidase [Gammaproteobacteria bacterium]|nr:S8 family serine peptidase [Gammaproteobacteria bacterium]